MKKKFLSLSEENKGYFFLILGMLLWGAFPLLLEVFGGGSMTPFLGASISTYFAGIAVGLILLMQKKSFGFLLQKDIWKDAFWVAFFIGAWIYGFLFYGAQYTEAINISILGFSEIFFCFFILGLLKHEKYNLWAYVGAILIVLGVLVLLYTPELKFNPGDLFVICAYVGAPIGNMFQRKLRSRLGSMEMMFIRSFLAGSILLLLAFIFEDLSIIQTIDRDEIWKLMFMGIIFMGLQKIIWIETIHRISITKANVLGALEVLITIGLVAVFFDRVPSSQQILGLIPIMIGAVVIVLNPKSFLISKR